MGPARWGDCEKHSPIPTRGIHRGSTSLMDVADAERITPNVADNYTYLLSLVTIL